MNTLPIPTEVTQAVRRVLDEALTFVEIATDFNITTQADADVAGEQLRGIVKLRKAAEDERKNFTRPYDDLKSRIMAEYKPSSDKLGQAESMLREELTRWVRDQERIAEEARRAEQERIDAERKAAEAAAAKEAAKLESLKTPAARARAEERLEEALRRHDEAAVTAPTVAAPRKTTGFGLRDNWVPQYEADALDKILAAVAARPELKAYLVLDTAAIARSVKVTKANTNIPGVKAVNEKLSVAR